MISSLANGKAPGPDRYTSEFYKLTSQTLVPTLAKVYEEILQGGDYIPSDTKPTLS